MVSFFRTATAESADARKAYSRGPPLYFVPPWNRLAPEVTQRTKTLNVFSPATHQTQRAVEFQKQFKKLQGVKVMLHDDDQHNDDF